MINLKHYIIKKLGWIVEKRKVVRFPDVFYGTSHNKLPKGITQEDLNNWYKRKDEKDK